MRRLAERPGPPPRPAAKLGSGPASAVDADERCELCGAGLPSRSPAPDPARRAAASSAPARPAGRSAPASRSSARRGPDRVARGLRPAGRGLGQLRRSRSASRSSCGPAIPSASSPSTRAPRARPSRRSTDAWQRAPGAEPGARAPRARRRGADRQPHGRAPPACDRADRRVLPAGRDDQDELGGDLGRDRGPRRRSRSSSPSCGSRAAPGRRRSDVDGESGRGDRARELRPPRSPRSGVRDRLRSIRSSARRGTDAALPARGSRTGPGSTGLHGRPLGAVHDRARRSAATTPAERERLVGALRRAGALGLDDRERSAGRRSTCSCRASAGRRSSRSRCRAPTTTRSPRPSTSRGLADGVVPLQLHFNGTVIYAAATGRSRCRRCRGTAPSASICRSRPGAA